ncbi:hypothetical protein Ancab_026846 [Ancistrocladus abbreviatus]
MALLHSMSLLLLLLMLALISLFQVSLEQRDEPKLGTIDMAALLSIKNSLTDLPGTRFFSTWDSTSPYPCSSFAGVACALSPPNTLRVISLALGTGFSDSPGLAGSLSPSISNLTELTQLILFPGFVTGPIPPQLDRLVNLRVLSLTHNRLTGPIPATITALRNLHTLDLGYNQLTGSIPPSLPGLTQLKVLVLASNLLSGALPHAPSQLLHMDLKLNRLTGPLLPSSLPSTLRYLSLSGNAMWGPLNNGLLEPLSELVYLDLSMNRFGGAIPISLFRPSLPSLLLQRNNFTGAIPAPGKETTPYAYGEGSIVDLSHNSLAGEPPAILAGVETLFLNNNRLSGTVPEEYVKSVCEGSMKTLYLQHNFLSGFPLRRDTEVPYDVDVCLSYNCMVPPVGLAGCPASAGGELSRPAEQCTVFRNGGNIVD